MNKSLLNLIAVASAGLMALLGLSSAQALQLYGDIHNNTDQILWLVSTEGSSGLRVAGDHHPPQTIPPGERCTFKYARPIGSVINPTADIVYQIGDGPGRFHCRAVLASQNEMKADFIGKPKSPFITVWGWTRGDNKENPGPLFILGQRQ